MNKKWMLKESAEDDVLYLKFDSIKSFYTNKTKVTFWPTAVTKNPDWVFVIAVTGPFCSFA